MKIFKKMKDGGPHSTVTGYWLIEWKAVFSIVLLKFEGQSRETYHTHAFNCISWLISGELQESFKNAAKSLKHYTPSLVPFVTKRTDFHKVDSIDTSWLLSIRGPWNKTWHETDQSTPDQTRTLSSGRKVVDK